MNKNCKQGFVSTLIRVMDSFSVLPRWNILLKMRAICCSFLSVLGSPLYPSVYPFSLADLTDGSPRMIHE